MRSDANQLKIRHFGHSAFEITTAGGDVIFIDPFGNSPWSRWFSRELDRHKADILLITHSHFDHNNKAAIYGARTVLTGPGLIKGSDYTIRGIAGQHAHPLKYGRYNTIFVIDVDGVRICHWGDNDSVLTDEQAALVGNPDILMVPVDRSNHLLSNEEVAKVVDRLKPRVIIPMHYLEANISSCCTPLGDLSKWLELTKNIHFIEESGTMVDATKLPRNQEIWLMISPTPKPSKRFLYKLPCFAQSALFWIVTACFLVACGMLIMLKIKPRIS